MSIRATRRVCLALLAGLGCEKPFQPSPTTTPHLSFVGWAEQGAPVEFFFVRGTDSISVAQAAVTILPAGIAEASFSGNRFIWKHSGHADISANVDGIQLTMPLDVTPPPLIVFDMEVDGNRDVYEAGLDGSGLVRLTTDPADDTHPSAAKGQVVFSSVRAGNGELYSRPIAASAAEVQLTTTLSINEYSPSLSADGATIAYVRDDGAPRIWTAKSDGTNALPLTSNPGFAGAVEMAPSWFATSDSVVFASTASGNSAIYAARGSSTSASRPVVPSHGDSVAIDPAMHSDGLTIAYATAVAGGSSRITVRPGTTFRPELLTPASINCAELSWVDGRRLVFTVFSGNVTQLAWVDIKRPNEVVLIALAGNPRRASAVR
jgi:Tol biopolymer transport system component